MITRRKPLKRSSTLLKRTPLRKVSKKRAKDSRIYSAKRKAFLEAHPWCHVWLLETGYSLPHPKEIRPSFFMIGKTTIGPTDICPYATDIHHTKGRTGTNYLDETTWLAVSREMHERIHNNPSWARERGYLLT